MNVGSTKELSPEKRISITPETSKSFKNLGLKPFYLGFLVAIIVGLVSISTIHMVGIIQ